MSDEKIINVPLDDETKFVLETSARENGRAVGREAAMLIKRGLASFRRGLARDRLTLDRRMAIKAEGGAK